VLQKNKFLKGGNAKRYESKNLHSKNLTLATKEGLVGKLINDKDSVHILKW
jgi:hypothetical protein